MARHIITVDDSKTMRDMVTFTLRGAGFQVSEAEDGQKALQVLKTTTVDLVITDQSMPMMNGIQLGAAIKAISPEIPVVLLTGFGDEILAESQARGAELSRAAALALLDSSLAG